VCLILLNAFAYNSMYVIHVVNGKLRGWETWVVKGYTTNWYQSQGFDTEPRWASGAVFGPKM
jgi:hypothetical protein